MTGLELILPTLVTTFMPSLADGVRGLFNWFTRGAGAQPANVEERVKLMKAENERLEALAKLDQPVGNISPWVADLRAAFRYVGAGLVILPLPVMLGWAFYDPSPERVNLLKDYAGDFAGPVWGFMFGDRLRIHIRR
jgi:hypothetical protein